MLNYIAPLRDMKFVLHEMLNLEQHYQQYEYFKEKVSTELINQYLEVAADFCQNELLPLNAVGDQQGCVLKNGNVKTPDGFKAAYDKYTELGFTSLTAHENYGGQGLPHILRFAISEMTTATNWSWGLYPGLSGGAVRTLETHGTDQQKEIFLNKLVSGTWTGTMCLTESHAGSDLGLIRSKAIPNLDGSYVITGEKIFISAGDHDLAENIVHIVLARLPNAPKGTKGISLFIVPKIDVDEQGNLLQRNHVECTSLEHKMGIHGNSTCVLNFNAAKGYLIGPENRGLNCMFTFMNNARVGSSVQGLAIMEASFQGALAYAKDRLAMRSLSGIKNPEGIADPIIVHPAVRNLILTQKAFAEGSRALAYSLAAYVDQAETAESASDREAADNMLALLTPIAKAFLTEGGVESAKHGMQVFGGHGYIAEHGMEQLARDVRISTLYEGTTEIQALDLLNRKVLNSNGALLEPCFEMIQNFVQAHADQAQYTTRLQQLVQEWKALTAQIQSVAKQNPDEIGAASVDYLYFSAYVILAYFWAKMAILAKQTLAEGTSEQAFYQAKIATADFYYAKILNRTKTHAANILQGSAVLMALQPDDFKFD